jgi:hypothetical protein
VNVPIFVALDFLIFATSADPVVGTSGTVGAERHARFFAFSDSDSTIVPHIDFAIDKGLIKAFRTHQMNSMHKITRQVYNENRLNLRENKAIFC